MIKNREKMLEARESRELAFFLLTVMAINKVDFMHVVGVKSLYGLKHMHGVRFREFQTHMLKLFAFCDQINRGGGYNGFLVGVRTLESIGYTKDPYTMIDVRTHIADHGFRYGAFKLPERGVRVSMLAEMAAGEWPAEGSACTFTIGEHAWIE
jgi:hypothetical protein